MIVRIDYKDKYQYIILLLSMFISYVVFIFASAIFGADSISYINFAHVWLGNPNTMETVPLPYRTMGYPLLLILTNVVPGNSFMVLYIVQSIMATLIPFIIYKIMNFVQPLYSFYIAIVSIISLVPYFYIKFIMTETSYTFFLLLSIYFAVIYFSTNNIIYFYITLLMNIVLFMFRPSANYLFIIFLVSFIFFRPKKIIHYFVGFIIVLLFLKGTYIISSNIYNIKNMEITKGIKLYHSIYRLDKHRVLDILNTPLFKEKAPNLYQIIDIIGDYLIANPQIMDSFRKQDGFDLLYRKFQDNPRKFAHALFSDRDPNYFPLIVLMVNKAVGPERSSELFWNASIENLMVNPLPMALFILNNWRSFFWGPPLYYETLINGHIQPIASRYSIPFLYKIDLKEKPHKITLLFYGAWLIMFTFFRPLVFLAMLINLPTLLCSKARPVAMLCLFIVLYSATVVCVFSIPSDRFVYQTFLVELILAGGVLMALPGKIAQGFSRIIYYKKC